MGKNRIHETSDGTGYHGINKLIFSSFIEMIRNIELICTSTGPAATISPESRPPTTLPSAPDKLVIIDPDLPNLEFGVSVGL